MIRKTLAAAAVVALGMLAATTGASAAGEARIYRVSASMNPRQVVTVTNKPWAVPAAYSKAKGTFNGTFDAATGKLTWKLTYSALARPKLRIVDIHYGTPGRFGAILTRVCVGCKSGQHGVVKVKRSARGDIAAGKAWVTLITEQHPNGVIRGQLKATGTS